MREIRPSGLEGGVALCAIPTPIFVARAVGELLRGAAVFGEGAEKGEQCQNEQQRFAGDQKYDSPANRQTKQDKHQNCQSQLHCPLI